MMQTIFPSRLVKLLVAMAVAASIGLGVGAWLLARLEEKLSALRFEQPEIDLRQSPAIEGDPIDVIGWRKPAPEFFAAMYRQADSSPEQVLYVGDDLVNDYQGARAAGVQAVLFAAQSPTAEPAAMWIPSLRELF